MEYQSFCILEGVLYLCTSDVCSLLAVLKYRGLDPLKADQGRIHHTNPTDFLIICSPDTANLAKEHLSSLLNGKLHFRGENIPSRNKLIQKVEYIFLAESVFLVNVLQQKDLCENSEYEQ